jgi:acyl-CoA thioester hydrolase
MPLTHTSTFRVRYYECDAYGHLNNTNYLRYMQEAAFDASAAAGYDMERYQAMGRLWLVRQSEIEYLLPVFHNQTVEVRTWVADIRRATSRRRYEFRLAGSGELVAKAHSDWVYLDSTTYRPASVPPEIVAAFFPEGYLPSDQTRQPFPASPPPPPGVFTTRRIVRWHDIDTLRQVNNPVYLEYISDCGMQVIAAHNWPVQRMIAEGLAILIRKHQIQYLQPAALDDELEIATWASDVRRSTAWRHYTIRRVPDGASIARVKSLGVWVDLAKGVPVRIPAQFLADFAANITA